MNHVEAFRVLSSLKEANEQGVLREVLEDFLYDIIKQSEGYGPDYNVIEAIHYACKEWDV